MDITNRIIEYIKENRVSTTEVADALGKTGAMKGIGAICNGKFQVGTVRCIFAANNSNYQVHEQIKDVKAHEVVIVFTDNCDDRAVLGGLVSKFLILYKRAEALVIDGLVRDVAAIRREGFPVWSKGVTPIGCFNSESEPFDQAKRDKILANYEGGVAVCDDGGVVVIPPAKLTEEMLDRLRRIEMQEDIWFFCLDHLKWDTKKIVCDAAYLHETDLLSSIHLKQLEDLSKPLDK